MTVDVKELTFSEESETETMEAQTIPAPKPERPTSLIPLRPIPYQWPGDDLTPTVPPPSAKKEPKS